MVLRVGVGFKFLLKIEVEVKHNKNCTIELWNVY